MQSAEDEQHREPSLFHLVKWAEMAMRNRVEEALRPLRLSPSHMVLIVMLEEFGEATAASLARAMHLRPQAMTTLLKPLDDRRLITRREDSAHRRRTLLALTDDAQRLLRELRQTFAPVEAEMLAGLTPDERSALKRGLLDIARTRSDL